MADRNVVTVEMSYSEALTLQFYMDKLMSVSDERSETLAEFVKISQAITSGLVRKYLSLPQKKETDDGNGDHGDK